MIEEEIEDESNTDKSFIRKIHRYQVDLRYAYQVGKRDFIGTAGIGDGQASTAFVNSRKPRPAAIARVSPSPSITTPRSLATPCWSRTTGRARWHR